ncbi:MAG: DedA family protein [Patescibacteria group bacterium]|nr:DedA family protein [Patescibacteria group bacterium]
MTALINFFIQIIIAIIDKTGYAGVFILMLLESCGLPIPSEIIMSFSGFLIVNGRLLFWLVVIFGVLGNLVGSCLAYLIGRYGGRTLIEKYGKYILISHHDLNLADRWFNKYGDWAVFFGRLLPVIRTYISFPAGIAEMNFKKFSLFTFLGVIPWTILFTWLGVKLGNNWELIQQKLHNFDLLMLLLLLLLIVLYIWRHLKNRNK